MLRIRLRCNYNKKVITFEKTNNQQLFLLNQQVCGKLVFNKKHKKFIKLLIIIIIKMFNKKNTDEL